jgi:DUF1365 family protein
MRLRENILLAEGHVTHRRWRPFPFAFSYAMRLVGSWHRDDVHQPASLPGPFCNGNVLPWRWRRKDYLPQQPGSIRQAAFQQALGRAAQNNDAVLHFGMWRQGIWHFNPVCFYLLYSGKDFLGVLSEITNTPWRQRHCYWTPAVNPATTNATTPSATASAQATFAKAFHISPFNPLNQHYRWGFHVPSQPGQNPNNPHNALSVAMSLFDHGHTHFVASLAMHVTHLRRRNWYRSLLWAPLAAVSVLAKIYWQAWRLHRRGAPYYPNPHNKSSTAPAPSQPRARQRTSPSPRPAPTNASVTEVPA